MEQRVRSPKRLASCGRQGERDAVFQGPSKAGSAVPWETGTSLRCKTLVRRWREQWRLTPRSRRGPTASQPSPVASRFIIRHAARLSRRRPRLTSNVRPPKMHPARFGRVSEFPNPRFGKARWNSTKEEDRPHSTAQMAKLVSRNTSPTSKLRCTFPVPPCSWQGTPTSRHPLRAKARPCGVARARSLKSAQHCFGLVPKVSVARTAIEAVGPPARWPNPSVKRSANGGPPSPRGALVYPAPRGLGVPPSAPAYLER